MYISWVKCAPKQIIIKCFLVKDIENTSEIFEAHKTDGFYVSDGGYTGMMSTMGWEDVQYIVLSELIHSRGNSVLSNIAVYIEEKKPPWRLMMMRSEFF